MKFRGFMMSEQLSFTQLLRKNDFIEGNNSTDEEPIDMENDFDPDENIENLEMKTFEEEAKLVEEEEARKAEEAKRAAEIKKAAEARRAEQAKRIAAIEESEDTRVIFIGNKPVMNYVLSIVTLMNKDVKRISIKARGKAINRAVDVAEVVRHKFVTKTQIEDILINTEELFREDGSSSNVSTIDIILRV